MDIKWESSNQTHQSGIIYNMYVGKIHLLWAYSEISLFVIGNALGGWDGSNLNQALCASVDDLLGNAVPANQTR